MAADIGTYRAYGAYKRQPSAERLAAFAQADTILREYESRGLAITLRQLYYQHVARGLIENSDASYNRLGDVVNDGRMAGMISWTAVEDRTRSLQGLHHWAGPAEAVAGTAASYRRDLWRRQPMRPEVWVEKEAVIAATCNRLRVDYFVTHGYNSQSEAWRAGRRLAGYIQRGQRPVVIHIGDHDPSGIHMTQDLQNRLATFVGVPVQVIRIALNWEQITALRPPPQPAKVADSRYPAYVSKFGELCWELDAIDPRELDRLIAQTVDQLRDEGIWEQELAQEVEEREFITQLSQEIRT